MVSSKEVQSELRYVNKCFPEHKCFSEQPRKTERKLAFFLNGSPRSTRLLEEIFPYRARAGPFVSASQLAPPITKIRFPLSLRS